MKKYKSRGFTQHHFHTSITKLFMIFNFKIKRKNSFKLSSESGAGFTLIELLVVIAIIAILAALVLYSATIYINKGKDATIKGKLAVLISAGELWYDKNGSDYVGFCTSPAVAKALEDAPSVSTDEHCSVNDGIAWAVCAKLFVDTSKAYCVDNKGNQKVINDNDGADYCTDTTINCCEVPTNCIE